MKKELKRLYCENCGKEFIEKEDVYFCPICASVLVDTGKSVSIEEPKKKQKNKKQLNKSIGNFDKKHKVKTPLPKLEFGEYMKIMGWFGAIATGLLCVVLGVAGCACGDTYSLLDIFVAPFEALAGFVAGWILGLMLFPIAYPLVRLVKGRKR